MTARAPEALYERPFIYPYQQDFIDSEARYDTVEAATKTGKTVGCIIFLAECAMGVHPFWSPRLRAPRGANYWWVAPTHTVAAIAMRRLKRALPASVYQANESQAKLDLANDATMWFKSAEKPDNLYGEDVYAAVIDEATRCREDAWHAIRSTLTATRGPVRIIGNVKGRRNWAYKLADLARGGTLPDMAYHKITAWDAVEAGQLERSEIEDAQRVLPVHVFKQLYECVPADDGGNPFGLAAIEACVEPLSQAPPAVWGWDLAKSHDWVVGIALDAQARVCRFERWQAPWRATKADIIQITRQTPALVDSTGVGDPILEDLQAAGVQAEGFNFGGSATLDPADDSEPAVSTKKHQLMEGLAAAIHQQAVHFPDGLIKDELDSFEFHYTRTGVRYGAPSGHHDDCVCALALAVKHWRDLVGMAAVESVGLRNVLAAYQENGEVSNGLLKLADPKVW